MNTARAIAFNTAVQLLAKIITAGTSLVVIAYLTRYLGVSGYGDYATIFAYLGLFNVFVDLGLFVTTVREIAKDPAGERRLLSHILGLRMLMGVVVFGLAYALTFALPYSPLVRLGVLIGAVSHWFMNLTQVPLSLFQARLTMHKPAIADVAGRFVLLGLVLYFISQGFGLLHMVVAVSAGSLIVFLMNLMMVNQTVRVLPTVHLGTWKRMLMASTPMGIVVILATIYFRIDVVMLSLMKGSFEVGVYSAPYKILEVLLAVPTIFMSSVLPVITKALIDNFQTAQTIFRKSFDFLAVAAWPFVVGGILLATPLMVWVAGPSFNISGPVLAILIISMIATFLNVVMVYSLVAAEQQNRLLVPYVIAVVFNVVTNWLVIPHFSYMGAAVTTVLTETLVLICSTYLVIRHLRLGPTWRVFTKSLLASLVMGVAVYYFRDWAVWWLMLMGGLVYVAMLFLTRAVTKADILEIMPQFKRLI